VGSHSPGGAFGLTSFPRNWAKQINGYPSSRWCATGQARPVFNTIWRIHSDAIAAREHLRLGPRRNPRGAFYGAVSCVGPPWTLTNLVNGRVSLLMGEPAELVRTNLLISDEKHDRVYTSSVRSARAFSCDFGNVRHRFGSALAARDRKGGAWPSGKPTQWWTSCAGVPRWGAAIRLPECGSAPIDRP